MRCGREKKTETWRASGNWENWSARLLALRRCRRLTPPLVPLEVGARGGAPVDDVALEKQDGEGCHGGHEAPVERPRHPSASSRGPVHHAPCHEGEGRAPQVPRHGLRDEGL